MRRVEIAIIGLGAWGLCVLDRITRRAGAASATDLRIHVHVIEVTDPGPGVHAEEQPHYLLLNTVCGQVSMFTGGQHTTDEKLRVGPNLFEWARQQNYRMFEDSCRIATDGGRELSPHDFLPRRVLGAYLRWYYDHLLQSAPSNLSITHHRAMAIDILVQADQRETVVLASGDKVTVDHVFLTTGYTENVPDDPLLSSESGPLLKPYPVTAYVDEIGPDESVGISGMGLVATDVVTALTVGRGGRYVADESIIGKRYVASGREPRIYLYSRNGLPYYSRPAVSNDLSGSYEPSLCTTAAIDAILQTAQARETGVDFRTAVLPLLFDEMWLVYFTKKAQLESGAEAGENTRKELCAAHRQGRFGRLIEHYESIHGKFDPEDLFFVPWINSMGSRTDYQAAVCNLMKSELIEARKGESHSPVKAALELFRVLRDGIRRAVDFGGLSLDSYNDFRQEIVTRINRIAVGPPLSRTEELLALVEAGVVRIPFGSSPSVRYSKDLNAFEVTSRRLKEPTHEKLDRVILGYIDQPTVQRSASPLLARLYTRGRLSQFRYGATVVDTIALTRDCHPINGGGDVEKRLWVLGPLVEGIKYFNHYVPSPKSRFRAFADADACVGQILGMVV
jgi:uncharacterized NAD(P)/FAD-binding protein YdhS